MGRYTTAAFLVLIAIAFDRACTLWFIPIGYYCDPFPFFDPIYYIGDTEVVGINIQYYIKAISVHATIIGLILSARKAAPLFMARFFAVCAIVEVLSLLDFLLIYEQGLFYIGKYHVEFTDFRILGHATAILLWKTGKL